MTMLLGQRTCRGIGGEEGREGEMSGWMDGRKGGKSKTNLVRLA